MKRKNSSEIHKEDVKSDVERMDVAHNSDSSESLYEIRLNEFVKKEEISDFDLRALVVRCSACGRQINHHSEKEIKKHRKLQVITCKECYEFYGSSEFSQDESGYNYCTWCGNGGKLTMCDDCPNGFCSACIRRNFGRAEISLTAKEGWKCYICNKTRLKPKVKFCDLIMSFKTKSALKKEKKSGALLANKTGVPEVWLQTALDDSEAACKNFTKKMAKLRSIGISKRKSLKHIVKKMEGVIEDHATLCKEIVKSMNASYNAYVERQIAAEKEEAEKKAANIETVDLSNDNENSKQSLSDCIIEDEPVEKKETVSDAIPLIEEEEKVKAERLKDKLKLLLSSSDSENNERATPPIEMNGVEKFDADLKSDSPIPVINDDDDDIIEITETPDKDLKKHTNKAKHKMEFNFSSMSDSDFELNKPNVDAIVEELVPEEDPKLKQEAKVELIRCDHLLREGQTTLVLSSDSDDKEGKLDKLVDSLCRFPRNRRKKHVPKAKRRSGPPSSKKTTKPQLLESSSSISLSSDEDEDQKKIQINNLPPKKGKSSFKPKDDSSSSSSSSIALDSESEEDKKKKKKPKGKKKVESDSSDDFVPMKKKKYDKLLHGQILSDDDEETKKPKEKPGRKPPRKRNFTSSSESKKSKSSGSSDDGSDSKGKKQPKKRRRIKKLGSSSDEDKKDGSQNKDKDTPGKGRKNIRKILSEKKIAMSTKEAQAEEKERKRRIAERQKLYNRVEEYKIPGGKEIVIRKMVLEVDPDTKEDIIEIHPDLVCKLKPHQVEGVKFMWECTIESVKDLNKPGSGCILAHCMGLGKTLQVITFLHTCLTNKVVNKVITRSMIICPYNTALNWANEFDYWLNDVEGDIKVHQLATSKSNNDRLDILRYWFEEGGVIIVSYDIFRRLAATKIPKLKKREKEQMVEYLLDPGPDIVVCDEGHILKNEKSAISVATNKVATHRRIVLTGTPLQNNLKEYHCMVSFVKPNLLGTVIEFRNRFVNPIINGQYEDSNEYDVRLMKRRIHILHKLLDGCVQRCDYSALTKFLPPKHEFVISVKLSETQAKMYECYLETLSTAKLGTKIAGRTLFADFNNLRNIWTHPHICHTAHERAAFKKFLKDDGEEDDDFINDGEVTEPESSYSSGSDRNEVELSSDEKAKKSYKTRSRAKNSDEEEEEEEDDKGSESKQWYHAFISDADKYNVELSGKMVLLLEILKECEKIGDKVLLFSQSLLALDMIEDVLCYSASNQKEEMSSQDVLGMWVKGIDYFRMDGATSADFRKSYIDMFNNPSNERSRLFLISTRAGSLGTNLVGANRVIIFDTSWNPSHDVQAIFRVYRFGQLKPVYIYRLLAQGTMEEKIYDRQVTKISLSYRVVDEQQIDRHFSAADLAELYTFDRNSTKQRPTPMLPKDRLLADLLIKQKEWIVTYHEHDSLLQNETETDLTEEERQAAWAEYENEKEGRGTDNIADGTNPTMADFDASSLTNEPDFSQDYEGRMIPELKKIVEFLFEKIKQTGPDINKNPLEFKKRLLSSVYAIRQAFQEKHVKVLRLKQEYCTRGTVPNAINKYMDELSQILKSTGDYITRLSGAITSEQTKLQKLQQQQQQQFQHTYSNPNMFRAPNAMGRGNPTLFNLLNTTRPINLSQMNDLQRAALNQYMQNMKASAGTFKSTSNNASPVITEVDDSVPSDSTGSRQSPKTSTIISAPSTSTVTIKEIT